MFSLLQNLKTSLGRTRQYFGASVVALLRGKKSIDAELLSQLEELLLSADVGITVTEKIMQDLTDRLTRQTLTDPSLLLEALKSDLMAILKPCEQPLVFSETHQPFVVLVIGVNGSGKTTTIAKLAHQIKNQGKKVLLAAGDTFRAAAIEQLQIWGERIHAPVIVQQMGADSAAVIFDAVQAAKARSFNVVIADTAGRLHTKDHLLEELKKVKRVIGKTDSTSPHEVLLILDATLGQNALNQAVQFHAAMGVTGLVLTKLDGTAKGGIIFAIAQKLNLPIRYIGVGETIEDLKPFSAEAFVEALFE